MILRNISSRSVTLRDVSNNLYTVSAYGDLTVDDTLIADSTFRRWLRLRIRDIVVLPPAAVTLEGTVFPSTPTDGQRFQLRAGTTPFEFVQFIYDATYGKWVSDISRFNLYHASSALSFTNTTYGTSSYVNQSMWIPNFKSLWDLGVRLELNLIGLIHNGSGVASSLSISGVTYNNANPTGATAWIAGTPVELTTTTTSTYMTTGWVTPSGVSATNQHLNMTGQVKVASASTGSINFINLFYRFTK